MFANARNGFSKPLNGHRLFKIISPVNVRCRYCAKGLSRSHSPRALRDGIGTPPYILLGPFIRRLAVKSEYPRACTLPIRRPPGHPRVATRRQWRWTGRTWQKTYCTNTLQRFSSLYIYIFMYPRQTTTISARDYTGVKFFQQYIFH